MNKDIICWWSGGITSAVACKKTIEMFGLDRCKVVMIDTQNEHEDTYRFKKDCEKWYGCEIDLITGISDRYKTIQDVWRYHESLNVATGAICSTMLKRVVRENFQKTYNYTYQVFGFEFDKKEFNRALSIHNNHSKAKGIFPLLMLGLTKEDCINIVQDEGIHVPIMYTLGFTNNNCFNTGCVQGGVGYWQKMRRDFPDKFNAMADMEHELTELRGEPVTMLKDQSNEAKQKMKIDRKLALVFLKKHPLYPQLKCIDDMPDCKVEPLMECNGFCGVNIYNGKSETSKELNFEDILL